MEPQLENRKNPVRGETEDESSYSSTASDTVTSSKYEKPQRRGLGDFLLAHVDGPVRRASYQLGRVCVSHPWRCLIIVSIFALFSMIGFAFVKEETDNLYLWTPVDAKFWVEYYKYEDYFGSVPRFSGVYILPKSGETTVDLTDVDLWIRMFDFDAASMGTFDGDKSYSNVSFAKVSPLMIWNFDKAYYLSLTSGEREASLTQAVQSSNDLLKMFGSLAFENGVASTCDGISFTYYTKSDTEEQEEIAMNFELFFEKKLKESALFTSGDYYITYGLYRSLDDETLPRIGSFLLLGVSLTLMSFYVFLALGDVADRVRSRGMLGMGAIFGTGVAIVATYGITGYLGQPMSSLDFMIPFLVLAIGIDDAFVIVNEYKLYDNTSMRRVYNDITMDKSHTGRSMGNLLWVRAKYALFKNRLVSSVSRAGPAVALTTLTDLVSFFVGTFSPFPALKYFCWKAFIAVAVDFTFQLTYFIVLTYFDNLRIAQNRLDFVPCIIKKKTEKKRKRELMQSVSEVFAKPVMSLRQAGFIRSFLTNKMFPVVSSKVGSICVILVWFCMLAYSGWSFMNIEQGLDNRDILPDDSQYIHYLNAAPRVFGYNQTEAITFVNVFDKGSDPCHDLTSQKALLAIIEASTDDDRFLKDKTEDFYRPFLSWLLTASPYNASLAEGKYLTTQPLFNQAILAFLATDSGSLYGGDIAFDTPLADVVPSTSAIKAVKFQIAAENMLDPNEALVVSTNARDFCAEQKVLHGSDVFPFAFQFCDGEQITTLGPNLLKTMIGAICATFVCCFLFLASLRATLFVVAAVVSVNVCMIGFFKTVGLPLNFLTATMILIGIGFTADYCSHIVHGFMHQKSGKDTGRVSRRARAREALYSVGTAVLSGGMSSFIGIFMISFAKEQTFKVSGYCLIGLIVIGLLHGMVLLPTLLSLFGPESAEHTLDGNEHSVQVNYQGKNRNLERELKTSALKTAMSNPELETAQIQATAAPV